MEAESEGGVFRDNYRGKQKHEMVAVRDIRTIFFFLMEERMACLDTCGNDLVETKILII